MKTPEIDRGALARDADGVIRIAATRVSLESVISAYRSGATIEDLSEAFPDLSVQDIEAAVSFYLENRRQVEEYLAARRREAEEVGARIREEFPEGTGRRGRRTRRAATTASPEPVRYG
jgi:uncharacterized protein (DUF433 family)